MTEFNKYYQDELLFLHEMGKEFAKAYPAIAPMLADRGSDPDVERLLEGFAFLTGRVRQKLDDEFPELVHSMMNLLWPHYIRPVPSMSVLEFTPVSGAVRERQRIAKGIEVASVPVEGTPCRFRTSYEVDLYPMTLEKGALETETDGKSSLRLRFALNAGLLLGQLGIEQIRLHLAGDPSYALYLLLCRSVGEIRVQTFNQGKPAALFSVPSSEIQPAGFKEDESLIPFSPVSFDGYRLLQEYFTFPEKFLFVDVAGLKRLSEGAPADSFELSLIFNHPIPATLRVSRENIRLYCTPIINLFPKESDPVRVNHEKVEYRIRSGGNHPLHYEIYSIDQAVGWKRGSAEEQEYQPFYSFNHGISPSGSQKPFYLTRLKEAVVGEGTESFVAFVASDQTSIVPPTETITFRLHCTNRNLAGKLRVGDIQTSTESSPEYAHFQNITKVSPAIRAPIGEDLYWKLISHLSLNYISLNDIQALKGILALYNRQTLQDKQINRANERRIEGLQAIDSRPVDLLFHGVPVRGTEIQLSIIEDHFSGAGDLFLFTTVLNEFFSLYASLNSFTRLTVKGIQQGEIYQWPPRIGQQILM